MGLLGGGGGGGAGSSFVAPSGTDTTFATDASGKPEVTIAPVLPTSKDQCKNDGWKNFANTFKNQGQCVSFVETGKHAA